MEIQRFCSAVWAKAMQRILSYPMRPVKSRLLHAVSGMLFSLSSRCFLFARKMQLSGAPRPQRSGDPIELALQDERITQHPALSDLTHRHAIDANSGHDDCAACRRPALKFTAMRAKHGVAHHHFITVHQHFIERKPHIRKRHDERS